MSSETDADGGYVHRPGGPDDPAAAERADGSPGGPTPTESTAPEAGGFGDRGWVLVGAVVCCFLVIPGVIYLFPMLLPRFGLGFFATFLLLPLVPAVILGLVAVWSMTAATK